MDAAGEQGSRWVRVGNRLARVPPSRPRRAQRVVEFSVLDHLPSFIQFHSLPSPQSAALEGKLERLRGGAALVSAADVARVEGLFAKMLEGWQRHKRIFMCIWNQVAENMEGKQVGCYLFLSGWCWTIASLPSDFLFSALALMFLRRGRVALQRGIKGKAGLSVWPGQWVWGTCILETGGGEHGA